MNRFCFLFAAVAWLFSIGNQVLAADENGSIKVRTRDDKGHIVNATVLVKSGDKTVSCVTKGGTCTIRKAAKGVWAVSASTKGGLKGVPREVSVKQGKTAVVDLTLKAVSEPKAKPKSNAKSAPKTEIKLINPVQLLSKEPGTSSDSSKSGNIQPLSAKEVKNSDLSKGKEKKISGIVRDQAGHVINGTVTVKQGDKVIGESVSSGGVYRIYDIPEGAYTLVFKSRSGKTKTQKVQLKKGASAKVNFLF